MNSRARLILLAAAVSLSFPSCKYVSPVVKKWNLHWPGRKKVHDTLTIYRVAEAEPWQKRPWFRSSGNLFSEGTRLVYQVQSRIPYDITFTLRSIGSRVELDYQMGLEDHYGHIVLNETSRRNAASLMHYFPAGSRHVELSDATCILLSEESAMQIEQGNNTDLIPDATENRNTLPQNFARTGTDSLEVSVDGVKRKIPAMVLKSTQTGNRIWISTGTDQLFLLRLDAGYQMVLKAIYTPADLDQSRVTRLPGSQWSADSNAAFRRLLADNCYLRTTDYSSGGNMDITDDRFCPTVGIHAIVHNDTLKSVSFSRTMRREPYDFSECYLSLPYRLDWRMQRTDIRQRFGNPVIQYDGSEWYPIHHLMIRYDRYRADSERNGPVFMQDRLQSVELRH